MKAIRVNCFHDAIRTGPGAFWYSEHFEDGRPKAMSFVDPTAVADGDGDYMDIAGISFEPGRWTFDGNLDEPTITPSIFIDQPTGWHGYLTKGEWVKA